jgi:riboflavin synthase alpha subunit
MQRGELRRGGLVNLEADVMARYAERAALLRDPASPADVPPPKEAP